MRRLIGAACVAFCLCAADAADLTWVNWGGDLKASTASNWSPAQTPQAGDNLTISYNGSGTKYWHNDLDIEYGHITFDITNTSATRIDPDQKEIRVSNGISVIGTGGTIYCRTSVTGTGEFLVDNEGGSVFLVTTPTSGRVYSGNFDVRMGLLTAGADKVLGDETHHGHVYIAVTNATASKTGKLTLNKSSGGPWNMYNDIYYDNNRSGFNLATSDDVTYYGDFYLTGGLATIQRVGGSGAKIKFYGKWERWTPPSRAASDSALRLFVHKPGVEFFGGFYDPRAR